MAEWEGHAAGDGETWDRVVSAFMPNADLAFGLLGTELWSEDGLRLALRAYRRFGRRGTLEFAGNLLSTCRDWATDTFASDRVHGLLAPWVLHAGLGPDAAASGFMAQVMAVAIELGGMPVPRGGGIRLVEALVRIVEERGGSFETGADVDSVTVVGGQAAGVTVAGGRSYAALQAVVANVTPTQLYGRLLARAELPELVRQAPRRFRYGRAEMQIHYALSELPRWEGDERLGRTAIVHVTPGLDGVSRAVNEADRGLLPAEGTIACGQPVAVDPSRAPGRSAGSSGSSSRSCPRVRRETRPASSTPVTAPGRRSCGSATPTASRRALARHIPNLESATLKRVVLSPADIEAANVNMVGGDIYAGSCALDQNLVLRPLPGLPGHRTPVARLYHIGASTHPGPGLGAGSGTLAARDILRPGITRRFRDLIPL